MALLESLLNPGLAAEIDLTNRALRVSHRPLEHASASGRVYGHYRTFNQGFVGVINASAILGNFRWTDPTALAVITRVWAEITVVTAVTAQRIDPMTLSIARGYTANDSTNATAVVIAGNSQKMRSNMGASLVGNIGVNSTAAGMSGGTKTADTNPIGGLILPGIGALGTAVGGDLYKWDQIGMHPIVLAQNEGLLVSWGATTIATGTVVPGIGFEWVEVPSF